MTAGYLIQEELGREDRYVLSRARGATGAACLLVQGPGRNGPSLAALRRESEVLSLLDAPGVPRLLELDETHGALVLEDRPGELLSCILERERLSVGEAIEVAGALANILGSLY